MGELQNVLINLKVLESLKCHDRLDTTNTLFRIHTAAGWIPAWAKRWWSVQSRVTDINRIQTLYTKAVETVSQNHADTERIKKYLSNSLQGLQNFKVTYEKDVTTVALLEVIIDNVTRLLS
jgi:hypothetical protein